MINNDGQHGLNQLDAYSNISGRNLRAAKHPLESIQKPTGRIVAGQKKHGIISNCTLWWTLRRHQRKIKT